MGYVKRMFSEIKQNLGVQSPSLLVFSKNEKPDEMLPLHGIKRGILYEKLKQLRGLPMIRISNQEQFNEICEVSYEYPDRNNKLKCVLYFHHGNLNSQG